MTSPGRRPGRAGWYLGGLGVLLVAAIVAGTLVERTNPAASHRPSDAVWSSPSVIAPTPHAIAPTTPAAPTTTKAPVHRYVFPVGGNVSYARTHHDYPASDIIAACGSVVRAVTDGVILELSRKDTYEANVDDGATRGGLFVSLLGDDGVRYYGSHLRVVTKGIAAGVRVRAGQLLGEVGETGDAGACHLHFGISPVCARTGDWWVRRGEVWPWSYLDSWRRGGAASPAAAVAAWQKQHGCPGKP